MSVTTAAAYADEVRRILAVHVRVDRDNSVLATTLPAAADTQMPDDEGGDVAIRGVDFRTTFFRAEEPAGTQIVVRLLTPVPEADQNAIVLVIGLTLGFLALALIFAMIVSRTLSSEVQSLLHAAQRLGAGTSPSACRPRATTSSRRWARSSTRWRASSRPAWRTCGGSAAACRRRSAASVSRSRRGWTAWACWRSWSRRRSMASAPPAGARRCAAAPTRRWRRSPRPASPRPTTVHCTLPRPR